MSDLLIKAEELVGQTITGFHRTIDNGIILVTESNWTPPLSKVGFNEPTGTYLSPWIDEEQNRPGVLYFDGKLVI